MENVSWPRLGSAEMQREEKSWQSIKYSTEAGARRGEGPRWRPVMRGQRRSKRGERCYRKVATQQGRNITICIAISSANRLAYYEIREGGQTN